MKGPKSPVFNTEFGYFAESLNRIAKEMWQKFIKLSTNKMSYNKESCIKLDSERCLRLRQKDILCHICVENCLNEAIDLREGLEIIGHKCNGCGDCVKVCPSMVFSLLKTETETTLSRREFFQRLKIK